LQRIDIHRIRCILLSEGVNLIYLDYYKTKRGDNPIKDYITSIDDIDETADIMETLDNIDEKGACYLLSGEEVTRSLGDGLFELKKSKHRMYYLYCNGNHVYMLHACYKQKNKAEKNDIEIGKKRMKEIKKQDRGKT
jgi:phage-related protein